MYKERDEEKRNEYTVALAKVDPNTCVYLDEAGIDNRLFREYARAPRGQKVIASIPGKKRERINIFGGLYQNCFVAAAMFKGSCTNLVLNSWLKESLLPVLPRGSTIIMDNAAFHKNSATAAIIEEHGSTLFFLPPYSPDMNPIEHYWHKLKSIVRPLVQTSPENLQAIVARGLSMC